MFKTHVLEPAILNHDQNSRGSQFVCLLFCIGTLLDQVHRLKWLKRQTIIMFDYNNALKNHKFYLTYLAYCAVCQENRVDRSCF